MSLISALGRPRNVRLPLGRSYPRSGERRHSLQSLHQGAASRCRVGVIDNDTTRLTATFAAVAFRELRRQYRVLAVNMNDWPARIDPEEAAIGRVTSTARRLVEASVSPNTRRAYAGALRRLDAWLDGRQLDDASLAAYVAELHDAGRASSSASMAVAAVCFRAKLAGQNRSRRRADGPSARRLPANCRRSGDEDKRGRSGSRTWRPCSPPATGLGDAGAVSSRTKSPSSADGSMRWSRDCCSWRGCGAAR